MYMQHLCMAWFDISGKAAARKCTPTSSKPSGQPLAAGDRITHLSPRMHRRLVEAVRSGANIKEMIIVVGLTDPQALRIENRLLAEFHKFRTDQLWNTIDERFMDRRWRPEKWHHPENVLYRLPRAARH